jgi:glyoxylase-like metal-dependent hydrolase (beta-lactamase superfamily II)
VAEEKLRRGSERGERRSEWRDCAADTERAWSAARIGGQIVTTDVDGPGLWQGRGVLLVETFAAGPLQCNCSVLACADTNDAIVIDPGGEVERIAEIVAHYQLTVRSIIHTHGHIDHIYCTHDVKRAHGGDICLHRDDIYLYDGFHQQCTIFGLARRGVSPIDRFVAHGDRIALGKHAIDVIHTPGHTPGSICFEVVDGPRTILFAGDTLFRRSVGRTDLPGGDRNALQRSIRERLYTRDPHALVVPGHGPSTTLAEEARGNPYVHL